MPNPPTNRGDSEPHAAAKYSAKGLRDRCFGRDVTREAFESIRPTTNLPKLRLNEATRDRQVTRVVNQRTNFSDINDVYTMNENNHDPPKETLIYSFLS